MNFVMSREWWSYVPFYNIEVLFGMAYLDTTVPAPGWVYGLSPQCEAVS